MAAVPGEAGEAESPESFHVCGGRQETAPAAAEEPAADWSHARSGTVSVPLVNHSKQQNQTRRKHHSGVLTAVNETRSVSRHKLKPAQQ